MFLMFLIVILKIDFFDGKIGLVLVILNFLINGEGFIGNDLLCWMLKRVLFSLEVRSRIDILDVGVCK